MRGELGVRDQEAMILHISNLRPLKRIDLLLDFGSFIGLDELARHRCTNFDQDANRPYGDGVVTGHGRINGRVVFVHSDMDYKDHVKGTLAAVQKLKAK